MLVHEVAVRITHACAHVVLWAKRAATVLHFASTHVHVLHTSMHLLVNIVWIPPLSGAQSTRSTPHTNQPEYQGKQVRLGRAFIRRRSCWLLQQPSILPARAILVQPNCYRRSQWKARRELRREQSLHSGHSLMRTRTANKARCGAKLQRNSKRLHARELTASVDMRWCVYV